MDTQCSKCQNSTHSTDYKW